MLGPRILVASMVPREGRPKPYKHGNRWQYHSRSDRHSKVACWGLMLDFLQHCALLRSHAADGLVGFGLNHEMRDFRTGRRKNLDLVICRPRAEKPDARRRLTFAERAADIEAILDVDARAALETLPIVREFPVGAVLVAVEAKACMTAFGKSRPRLYDELNSSHQTIHGDSIHTIAAGLTLVNLADEFISPDLNKFDLATHAPVVSRHNQPRDAERVIEKLREIPRRAREGEEGFDAFGITAISCKNDGSPVAVVEAPPAPQPGDIYHYEGMVHRLGQLYEHKFRDLAPRRR